jgi:hypothetical protein
MTPQQQLDALARQELFIVLKSWCLCLGLVALSFGAALLLPTIFGDAEGMARGWHEVGNAGGMKWQPFFTLVAYGGLTSLALPLLGAGLLLLIAALVLWFLTRKTN